MLRPLSQQTPRPAPSGIISPRLLMCYVTFRNHSPSLGLFSLCNTRSLTWMICKSLPALKVSDSKPNSSLRKYQ